MQAERKIPQIIVNSTKSEPFALGDLLSEVESVSFHDVAPADIANNSIMALPHASVEAMIQNLHAHPKLLHIVCAPFAKGDVEATLRDIVELEEKNQLPHNLGFTHHITMTRYSEKTSVLASVDEYARTLNAFPDFASTAATIASELLMNAAFSAPIDVATGQAKYAHLPRTADLRLDKNEQVEISFGYERDSFIIAAKDHFGTLTRDTVVKNLYRCNQKGADQVKQEGAGAGVGLYLLLGLCTRLDILISPGTFTEVVCRVGVSKRQKDYELKGKAINFFIAKETP